jgi:hypothetical protein
VRYKPQLSAFIIAFAILAACRAPSVESDNWLATKSSEIPTPVTTPQQLTEKDLKRKKEIEQKMLKGELLHDGSGELAYIGDLDSVPALLVVLRKNPAMPNGTMICTRAHALMALRKITGENPGSRTEDWEKWWSNHQVEQ